MNSCVDKKSTFQKQGAVVKEKEGGMKDPGGQVEPKLRNIDEEIERWWLSLSSNLGPSL